MGEVFFFRIVQRTFFFLVFFRFMNIFDHEQDICFMEKKTQKDSYRSSWITTRIEYIFLDKLLGCGTISILILIRGGLFPSWLLSLSDLIPSHNAFDIKWNYGTKFNLVEKGMDIFTLLMLVFDYPTPNSETSKCAIVSIVDQNSIVGQRNFQSNAIFFSTKHQNKKKLLQ